MPNTAWVSDITYVRNYEGFLYLATVIDLFSSRVVGWSMDKNMDKHLVIGALLMAVYKRRPKDSMLVHSEQGSQYGSSDYLAFIKEHNLKPSISRRGNCHDSAVAESFFATFKKRVTRKKIYSTRDEAKTEIFNFIEMFYNPKKRHSYTGGVSPAKFEKAYFWNSKLSSESWEVQTVAMHIIGRGNLQISYLSLGNIHIAADIQINCREYY